VNTHPLDNNDVPNSGDTDSTSNAGGTGTSSSSPSSSSSSIQSDPEADVGTAGISANSSAEGVPISPKTVPAAANDDAVNPYIELESPAVVTPPATGVFFICRVNFTTTQPNTPIQISGKCRVLEPNPAVSSEFVIGSLDKRSEDDPDAKELRRGESDTYEVTVPDAGNHFIEFNFVNDDAGAAVPMTQCFASLVNPNPCKPWIITTTETRTERCPPPYEHIEFTETWRSTIIIPGDPTLCDTCDDCCEMNNVSDVPMQAATGLVTESQTDLDVNLCGVPVVISREYSNTLSDTVKLARVKGGLSGGNWLFTAQPQLVFLGSFRIVVSRGVRNSIRFDKLSSGEWISSQGKFYALKENANCFLLLDKTTGFSYQFDNASSASPGIIRSITLPNGTTSASYNIDEATDSLFTIKSDAGFVQENQWVKTGEAKDQLQATYVRRGFSDNGTKTKVESFGYAEHTVEGETLILRSSNTAYRKESVTGDAPAQTTFSHEFYPDSLQVKQRTTTFPVVSSKENGNDIAATQTEILDEKGHLIWKRDGRGVISFRAYDDTTSALLQRIDDVDTTQVSNAPDGISYTYTRQQLLKTKTDQNGTTHTYNYDASARQIADIVSSLGTGVDNKVLRIETAFDDLDRVTDIVSFDAATGGNVVNAVQKKYNGFGQLLTDTQEHVGAVTTNSLGVNYEYVSAQNNCTTWLATTYPDTRTIEAAFNNRIDEFLGRPGSLFDSVTGGNIADYSYLGEDTVINALYPGSNVMLTYLQRDKTPIGDGGDQYDGLDRFGRIIDQRWEKFVSQQPILDRYKYTYNRGSLRLTRANLIAAAQANPVYLDELYSYDGLTQITDRQLGQLSPDNTSIVGTPTQKEDWGFDPAGNWRAYQQDDNGVNQINQTRTHNEVNEIVSIDSSTSNVAFDPAGNMTTIPSDAAATQTPFTTIYDAWSRLVRVQGGQNNIDISYEYDGLFRRTRQLVTAGTAPSLDFYYNDQWKIVEERIIDFPTTTDDTTTSAPATTPPPVTTKIRAQYIYGVRDRNDLIFRDYSEDGLVENTRLYVMSDAMFSTTAIADATGTVTQRLNYTAFGIPTFLTPDFTTTTNTTDWQVLLHGEYYDTDTLWSNYGYRYHSCAIGKWITRDRIGEVEDVNLTRVAKNNLISLNDKYGLATSAIIDDGCQCGECTEDDEFDWGCGERGEIIKEGLSRGNCYRHACKAPVPATSGIGDHDAFPGGIYHLDRKITCDAIMNGMEKDGAKSPDEDEECPSCHYKVLTVVNPSDNLEINTFHFYRQSPDGTWRSKDGSNCEVVGIFSPTEHAKSCGYTEICGYMCIPCRGITLPKQTYL
jgi:RHS repeat-associated protein